ncbi:MAG: DUF1508 domain-containing protein [Ruminococcaceae bacterium]|nr:DUF1508 domain-containing protein [Oscillospiraceae bacterium]
MAFWNRNKKKQDEPEKKAAQAAPAVKEKAPAAKAAPTPTTTTKVAPAKAPAKATNAAGSASTAPKSTVKVAPAKAPAGVAKAPAAPAKAPATKAAPATKTATPAAVKLASQPATEKAAAKSPAGRPFFATTEEDIRAAFDAAIEEAEAEIAKNGAKAIGKYEFSLEVDGYHFCLIANNGQVLFDSPSFTTLLGALNGIKTFKKTVATSEFDIKKDKYDRYRFILVNKYYGENYTTKDQCQKSAESVRNFANNARIIRYKPDKEALAAYEYAKVTKKGVDDVDWNAIAKAEATAAKKGKFEISREENGEYSFYLLASNGQILYASRFYATEAACRKGIESFKRAAYVGNFYVDRDKFGNFRYVLKNIGSAPSFIGESYDNKPQCEKIIESVKNFIVTASIEVDVNEAEG